MRQQKRNLRNRVRHILDSNDPITISVGDRVIRAVCQEPDPEFAALHLYCAAQDMQDDTGEPWVVCMVYLMDKFDDVEKRNVEAEQPKSTTRLRRLLRSLVPSRFRARHETPAEAGSHQQLGGGVAPPTEVIIASDQS